MAEPDVVITHPNRDKASSKITRAIVLLLLVASIVLLGLISYGGWDKLVGAKPLEPIWMAVYAVMAYYVVRWNRGVLPMAAALAVILGIFAVIAAPEWFIRDRFGYDEATFGADLLGTLTYVLIPVQVLLIAFSMRGFQQAWNVELEVPATRGGYGADSVPA